MKIANFAVKRPVTMIVLVAVVIIMGFFTLSKIPVDLYPEMKLPYAAVITSYAGAGPEEVESQVSQPIEAIVGTIGNVKSLQSISSSGNSMVLMEFNWGTNMDNATVDIREKIGIIEKYLPAGTEKPMVVKMDPTMMPILQMGISAGDKISLAQLQSIAEDVIQPRLSRIPQIASVTITGGLEREIKVQVDPVKLEAFGLSLSQVNQVLQAENFNMSSGKVGQGEREYYVRDLQQFESIDDIKEVAILTPMGTPVYLGDIAAVIDGYKDDSQLTRVDGSAAVGIHCLKQSDANTVAACAAVKEEMKKIEKELGMDLNVKTTLDQSTFINQSLATTKRMILEGALLAMLILFLFLRNGRSTLIIITAIPLSIIATFILMYFNNSTVNLITLGGLALGLGRMVDDSIVVFENIYRHRAMGLPPLDAAITGASEVGNAVIASTLTIMAVFLPVLFTTGLAGVLFKPLAITISFAIFCSLIVALTVVPLMSSRMLTDESMKKKTGNEGRIAHITSGFGKWIDGLGERYATLLKWSLGHRKKVIIIVTLLMIASCAAIPLVGAEFLPKMDSGEISIAIETDKGSQLQQTNEIIAAIEEKLKDTPEVFTIFTSVGRNANQFLDDSTQTNQGSIYVKLVLKDERQKDVDILAEEIRSKVKDIAGAKIEVSIMDATSGGMGSVAPINVQVRGDDLQVLKEISNQIAEIVKTVPGTREVSSSLTDGNPELQIKIDRKRAATYGLTPMQVSAEIKNALQGTVATRYKVEGDEVDIRVGYVPQGHEDLNFLQNLTILTQGGAVLKLGQIATFEMAQGPTQITRVDQVRKAEINAYLLNRDLKAVMADIQSKVAEINLPNGYVIEYGGENKEMMESFSSLGVALLLAIILVYAVMAIQYESFFNPFVIMFSIPTALIGVVLGLLLTGRSFSVPAFIGLIMLVGIVVANAIVLVDYLKQLRDRGMERNAAIIEAGRVRLRPILMTAFATILAMFPLALGVGEGAESEAPLATVVIGGLLVSTLITLVLVPVIYSLFDDWGQKISRRFKKKKVQETEITA